MADKLSLKGHTLCWGEIPICYVDVYTEKGHLPEVRVIVDCPDNPDNEPRQIVLLETPGLTVPNP